MRPDDPMQRSGAVWCDEHGRWECASNSKRTASRCHGSAITGSDRCRMHAGRSAAMTKALGEANLLAWSTEAARAEGAASLPALDPGTVVLDQLRVAVLRADVYGELLRWQLELDDLDGAGGGGRVAAGLVGTTYAASRDGARVETGEQVRALARMEAEWRDRVVRFAKTAHDMGIADAQIELQQAQAELVVSAFLAALAAIPGLLPVARQEALTAFLAGLGRGGETVAGAVVAGAGEPA